MKISANVAHSNGSVVILFDALRIGFFRLRHRVKDKF